MMGRGAKEKGGGWGSRDSRRGGGYCWGEVMFLRAPKIEPSSRSPSVIEISSEIEDFKRATHQTPFFVGNLEVKIENFRRDCKFLARLYISSEIDFFQSLGPQGSGALSRKFKCVYETVSLPSLSL